MDKNGSMIYAETDGCRDAHRHTKCISNAQGAQMRSQFTGNRISRSHGFHSFRYSTTDNDLPVYFPRQHTQDHRYVSNLCKGFMLILIVHVPRNRTKI